MPSLCWQSRSHDEIYAIEADKVDQELSWTHLKQEYGDYCQWYLRNKVDTNMSKMGAISGKGLGLVKIQIRRNL
jgi:dTDP-D-glucose 4,6-dehydratase